MSNGFGELQSRSTSHADGASRLSISISDLVLREVSQTREGQTPASDSHGQRGGCYIGSIVAIGDACTPLVVIEGEAEVPTEALSIHPISAECLNRRVLIVFPNGSETRPVIVGFLQEAARADSQPLSFQVDKERLTLVADREIKLQCGDASLTLTKAGKVIIRGNYVLSRSAGVNSIKGGSVQIN